MAPSGKRFISLLTVEDIPELPKKQVRQSALISALRNYIVKCNTYLCILLLLLQKQSYNSVIDSMLTFYKLI